MNFSSGENEKTQNKITECDNKRHIVHIQVIERT